MSPIAPRWRPRTTVREAGGGAPKGPSATRVGLLTAGDPRRLTGGYLFHRRMAALAPQHGAQLAFASVPAWPLPWALHAGPRWLASPAIRAADVVVLDSIAAAAAAPWLRWVPAPIVGMLHQPPGGIDAGPLARYVLATLDRWAYRRCAALMVASDWLATELSSSGVPAQRIRVVPPGKDAGAWWAPYPEGPDPGGTPPPGPSTESWADLRRGRRIAALCVANWLPRKGIVELLEALAALPEGLVTLQLVGDPAVDARYARRVRARLGKPDLRRRVVVHGVVPPATVNRLYQLADLFVLPSFEEPYGTVWGEAMAAGLPVVGWRAGNLPFLVESGREGLLVPTGDAGALGEAIAQLAEDTQARRHMGRAAARRAAARPTWAETAEHFFGVIHEVRTELDRRGDPDRTAPAR